MTVVVLMGVAGSGKTTVGHLLAQRLGWDWQEGDALHPPANVAKMSRGTPLTDADRWPWLEAIASVIDGWLAAGRSGVVACSALRRAYRDVLIGDRPDVRLVYLEGDRTLIEARMAARREHFMPVALLDSQFATLEPPAGDEHALVVPIDAPPDALAERIAIRMDEPEGTR
jgi:gluconokinase